VPSHAFPHAPQLFLSLWTFVHIPLHMSGVLPPQTSMQLPATHISLVPHFIPQLPQLS
jgi:hypothetical protein